MFVFKKCFLLNFIIKNLNQLKNVHCLINFTVFKYCKYTLNNSIVLYLVTDNSISSIAFSFRVGQSTGRNIIKEVCTVISNTLNALYLTVPIEEEWKLIVDFGIHGKCLIALEQ